MTSDPGRAQQAWGQHLRRRIAAVLASIPGGHGEEAGVLFQDEETPAWISMPMALDQSWSEERGQSLASGVLDELLWGQYALFLCIRLQDDLLDETGEDLRLILVADHFLIASLEAFQRFPELDDAFWARYRGWIRDTVNGDIEVEDLEADPGRFTKEHLGLHARVSAVLKVGVAAVARMHGRDEDVAWLSRFLDHAAVVHQITDDLDDLVQDLTGGRYTWVANTILALEPGASLESDECARRLREGFLQPERGAVIAEELRRIARDATAEVPPSAPPAIHEAAHMLHRSADELEQRLHMARVRWVFGETLEQVTGGDAAARR